MFQMVWFVCLKKDVDVVVVSGGGDGIDGVEDTLWKSRSKNGLALHFLPQFHRGHGEVT
jgi:hypothetical protein